MHHRAHWSMAAHWIYVSVVFYTMQLLSPVTFMVVTPHFDVCPPVAGLNPDTTLSVTSCFRSVALTCDNVFVMHGTVISLLVLWQLVVMCTLSEVKQVHPELFRRVYMCYEGLAALHWWCSILSVYMVFSKVVLGWLTNFSVWVSMHGRSRVPHDPRFMDMGIDSLRKWTPPLQACGRVTRWYGGWVGDILSLRRVLVAPWIMQCYVQVSVMVSIGVGRLFWYATFIQCDVDRTRVLGLRKALWWTS